MHEFECLLAVGIVRMVSVGVLTETLKNQFVVGEFLYGLNEQCVEGELSLVITSHAIEEFRKCRSCCFGRSDGVLRFIPIVHESYVGFQYYRLRELKINSLK